MQMKVSYSLLDKDGYITLNKLILKYLGIDAAIMYGELWSEFIFYYKNHMLTEDGYFFSKAENIEANTTLSPYKQREALKILKEKKLVKVDFRGVPAKNYFYIDTDVLDNFLNSDIKNFEGLPSNTPSSKNISQPAVKNFEGSLYNNTEEEILNNINILEDKKENKQIINKGSNLTALQALEILKTNLNSEVYETLKNFIQMRKTIKKPITGYALRLLVDKLKRMTTDPQEQINILNRSILNSWQDIFDPNERKPRQPQPNRYDRPAEPEEDDVIERLKAKYKAEEEAKKRAEGGL
jgi:hypothetical protein